MAATAVQSQLKCVGKAVVIKVTERRSRTLSLLSSSIKFIFFFCPKLITNSSAQCDNTLIPCTKNTWNPNQASMRTWLPHLRSREGACIASWLSNPSPMNKRTKCHQPRTCCPKRKGNKQHKRRPRDAATVIWSKERPKSTRGDHVTL